MCALESPAQEGHRPVGVGPEEGHKDNARAGAPLLSGKAESWGCSAWRREGCGETLLQPLSTSRVTIGKMGKIFLAGLVVIGQGVMALI